MALTRSLALEWAPRVRVNAVCPGYVLTPMQEAEYSPEMLAEVNGRIPLGRHATPEEIAGLFAYLASDEATYFTGSVIVMDGGETAGSVISGPGRSGRPGDMTAEPQWKVKTAPESRRAVFAAAVVVIGGQAWVAHSLRLDPFWLLPAISAVLLLASIAVYESQSEPGRAARALTFAFNAVLVIANAVSLVLLVRGVFVGSQLRPPALLFAGLALWVVNVAVFALLYWEMDGGGPEARADGYVDGYPDFVFPQQQADQQGLAEATWKPSFSDYLLPVAHELDRLLTDGRDAVFEARQARDGDRAPALVRDPGGDRREGGQYRARLRGGCGPPPTWGSGPHGRRSWPRRRHDMADPAAATRHAAATCVSQHEAGACSRRPRPGRQPSGRRGRSYFDGIYQTIQSGTISPAPWGSLSAITTKLSLTPATILSW